MNLTFESNAKKYFLTIWKYDIPTVIVTVTLEFTLKMLIIDLLSSCTLPLRYCFMFYKFCIVMAAQWLNVFYEAIFLFSAHAFQTISIVIWSKVKRETIEIGERCK